MITKTMVTKLALTDQVVGKILKPFGKQSHESFDIGILKKNIMPALPQLSA